jgi:hypothetical protein
MRHFGLPFWRFVAIVIRARLVPARWCSASAALTGWAVIMR